MLNFEQLLNKESIDFFAAKWLCYFSSINPTFLKSKSNEPDYNQLRELYLLCESVSFQPKPVKVIYLILQFYVYSTHAIQAKPMTLYTVIGPNRVVQTRDARLSWSWVRLHQIGQIRYIVNKSMQKTGLKKSQICPFWCQSGQVSSQMYIPDTDLWLAGCGLREVTITTTKKTFFLLPVIRCQIWV